MGQIWALVINVLLYLFSLVYYVKKQNFSINVLAAIWGIWLVSSMMGIHHFYSGIRDYSNLTILPFLVLWLYLVIFMYPIAKFKNHDHRFFCLGNERLILYIGYFSILVCIIPFIENVYALMHGVGKDADLASYLSDLHDERQTGEPSLIFQYSQIGMFFFKFIPILYEVSFLLLFYSLSKEKVNLISVFAFLFVILDYNLYAFLVSGRSSLVYTILQMSLCYLLFRNSFSSVYKVIINKIVVTILLVATCLFLYITISRLTVNVNLDFSFVDFITWYAGEGTLNFNEYILNSNCSTEGDYTSPYFKTVLGLDTFEENYERREFWAGKTGIPQNIFYTFIGNFISDYGLIISLLLFLIFAYWSNKIINSYSGNTVPLHKLLLLIFLINVVSRGFCFFPYAGMSGNKMILYLVLWYLLFKISLYKFKRI